MSDSPRATSGRPRVQPSISGTTHAHLTEGLRANIIHNYISCVSLSLKYICCVAHYSVVCRKSYIARTYTGANIPEHGVHTPTINIIVIWTIVQILELGSEEFNNK